MNMKQARAAYRKTSKSSPFRAWARSYIGLKPMGKLARIVGHRC